MIKVLNHSFIYEAVGSIHKVDYTDDSIDYYDVCKYCSNSFINILNNLRPIIGQAVINSPNVEGQLEILNKHYPCITEDEWMIKSIIE